MCLGGHTPSSITATYRLPCILANRELNSHPVSAPHQNYRCGGKLLLKLRVASCLAGNEKGGKAVKRQIEEGEEGNKKRERKNSISSIWMEMMKN